MSKILILIFCCLTFSANCIAAPLYVYKQADGSVKFTNKRPPSGVQAKVYVGKHGSFSRYKVTSGKRTYLFKDKYSDLIKSSAKNFDLKPALIKAVIHTESAFNPKAVSPKGALGLMQLMPANVKAFKVNDPFNPAENIQAGCKLLATLLKKYSLDHALAAYNAGEKAVHKYNGIPPYRETKNYVKKVLNLYQLYS